jgi:hypothetical protein
MSASILDPTQFLFIDYAIDLAALLHHLIYLHKTTFLIVKILNQSPIKVLLKNLSKIDYDFFLIFS